MKLASSHLKNDNKKASAGLLILDMRSVHAALTDLRRKNQKRRITQPTFN